jgi:uncharacterized protein (TIGR02246 family)
MSRAGFFLLLATACSCARGGPVDSGPGDRDAARIRSLDDAWAAAAARRDLDGMMAIYASDAEELIPGSPPIVGHDAIRQFYRNLLDRLPRFVHHFEPETITVAESRDLAVVRGWYRFTADTLDPDRVQIGKFVGVWGRRSGEWRLLMNISNSSQPDS